MASLRQVAGRGGGLGVDTGCGYRIDRRRARIGGCIIGCEHTTISLERGCVKRDAVRSAAHLSGCGSHKIRCLPRLADGKYSGTAERETMVPPKGCFGRRAIVELQAPGKGPNAVRIGKGVDDAGDQLKGVTGREVYVVADQFNAAVDD